MLRNKHIPTKRPNPFQYFLDCFHNSVAQYFRDFGTSMISSSSNGRYAPSLASKSTVPLSRHIELCHWPFSLFRIGPPGYISTVSTIPKLFGSGVPSLRVSVYPYRSSSKWPFTHTHISLDVLCLWIGITVSGSMALSILWEQSFIELRRSKLHLLRDEYLALPVRKSRVVLSITIAHNEPFFDFQPVNV